MLRPRLAPLGRCSADDEDGLGGGGSDSPPVDPGVAIEVDAPVDSEGSFDVTEGVFKGSVLY